MAYTEHLPIYKASYALCLYLEQVVRQFSRYHRFIALASKPLSPATTCILGQLSGDALDSD